MATFVYKGKNGYIDNRLKQELDTKIFPQLTKKDEDVIFIVDGKERSGKSKFADLLGGYAALVLETEYNLTNICMTPLEFRRKIETSPKHSVVIYDEAHRGMGSRRALSEINNILIDLMMEMGQRNIFCIIVLPTIFMLDRYPALFRARGLFHIYKKKGMKGFWVFFNENKKKLLFIKGKKFLDYNCVRWPRFRGRFLNQYIVDEAEYRRKKETAFKDKPRLIKSEVFKNQRDIVFYILNKEFSITHTKISALCKKWGFYIKRNTISEIITEKEKEYAEKVEQATEMPIEEENEGDGGLEDVGVGE